MTDYDIENGDELAMMVRSNIVWDLVDHDKAPQILSAIGMIPPSQEGITMACLSSHRRMLQIAPISMVVDAMCSTIVEVMIKAILENAENELDPQLTQMMVYQYVNILSVGSKVLLANLMATGIIQYALKDHHQ